MNNASARRTLHQRYEIEVFNSNQPFDSLKYARKWDGEWEFDLALKPLMGFPAYFGWVRAIFAAHAKVHAGLALPCPVLSMYSDEADIVLDWKQVSRWSRTLGKEVAVLQFPGGLHDLVLSRAEIRDSVFNQLFAWAARTAA
jgi:alpha-beta hydrolase superfamily lysophospholipase